jgi:putative transcriptional regulator
MTSLAGSFLVARPVLKDPSFRQTVVLLLQHGAAGAFGLVVNRQASVEGLPFPVFVGGPCEAQGLLMLHGHSDWVDEGDAEAKTEVAPGIFVGDADSLSRATQTGAGPAVRFRVFKGYAGWGPSQLEGELAAGAWSVVPATGDVLFNTPTDDLWSNLLPPLIPQPSLN